MKDYQGQGQPLLFRMCMLCAYTSPDIRLAFTGPLVLWFNIFMNDIFFFSRKSHQFLILMMITLSYSDKCLDTTKEVLVNAIIICIK